MMVTHMSMDAERFRAIFGSFPTAVAIITALDEHGEPRGFTCNAVCSVSAAPPTLLISVGKQSQTLPALVSAGAFVVNFLAASGEQASRVFAGKGRDKFEGLEWEPSVHAGGAPILTGIALAHVECRTVRTVDAGDHWILIAEIHGGEKYPREPLLYCQGRYSPWPALATAAP
ncbi:flavin reductase family protein [Streptomyces sp. NPDC014779]|uniref:flavin reductase family protein n=1 Tax=unclassified Streptomyces TaxID=2593676 RepID=UPI0036F6DED3